MSRSRRTDLSLALRRAIERLDAVLFHAYGVDYSYTIAGRGHVIAANNYVDGRVGPRRRRTR